MPTGASRQIPFKQTFRNPGKQGEAKQRSNQPAANHRSLPLVFKQRFLLSVPLLFQLPALYLSSKCQLWPVGRFKRAKRHTEVSLSLSLSLPEYLPTSLYLSIQGMITVRGSGAAVGGGRRILSRVRTFYLSSPSACHLFFVSYGLPLPPLKAAFRARFPRRAGKIRKTSGRLPIITSSFSR